MNYGEPATWAAQGLIALMLASGGLPAQAQTPALVPDAWDVRMARLLDEKSDPQSAYRLSQESGATAHPDYALWRGIAAESVGRLDEAIGLLETFVRTRAGHPQLARAQLELARSYILAGQAAKAEPLFQEVLRQNPPAQVARNIELWRGLASKSQPALSVQGYVETGIGYDTNPAGGVSAASISLPGLGAITLDPSAVRRASSATNAEAAGQVSYRLAPTWTLLGVGSLTHSGYTADSDLNLGRASAQLGAAWGTDALAVRGLLVADTLTLGQSTYRDYSGGVADASWRPNPQDTASLMASAGEMRYAGSNASRDARSRSLGLTFSRAMQDAFKTQASTTLSVAREDNLRNLPHLGRQVGTARVGLSLQPAARVTVSLSYQQQLARHQGDDPLLGIRRRDKLAETSLSLAYALSAHTTVTTAYSALRNRSNAELWEFDRSIVSVKLRYQF